MSPHMSVCVSTAKARKVSVGATMLGAVDCVRIWLRSWSEPMVGPVTVPVKNRAQMASTFALRGWCRSVSGYWISAKCWLQTPEKPWPSRLPRSDWLRPTTPFVKSDCEETTSGLFGLTFTSVSLSASQAVRPATREAAASDVLRICDRIIM